jgi:histidine ammonia-lyase
MSQIALLMMGEGEAFYMGQRLPGCEAMARAGISIPGLEARDGLATINGSNLLTAMSALHLYDMNRWLKQAEIACAMTLEALYANMKPYDERLHSLRGFSGAVRSARAIRKCIEGSDLVTGKMKVKVQDAYSMRSSPQVIGAAHDAIAYARSQVETELNGVGDNPIFLPNERLTLTGANFQGTPVSLPMDMAGVAITMVCVLSERRLNRLTNPALSVGLPPFLTQQAGDFVSMGMNTALKNGQILDNAYGVLGIEFMAAAQALDFRTFATGKGVTSARQVIRQSVPHLDIDRPLNIDHNKMKELVKSGRILEIVEETVGSLE